jgi:L-ascorbate metabolism protein UlaG (beta-lactamase superfamily)
MAELNLTLPNRAGAGAGEPDALWFVGHATTILSIEGITFLVDPVFVPQGQRVRCGPIQRPRRRVPPAVAFDQLPPFDVVLATHDDEDHLCPIVKEWLPRNFPIVTTTRAAGRLQNLGFFRATGLDEWDTVTIERGETTVRITALPTGAPKRLPSLHQPSLGFFVEVLCGDRYRNVYFSGEAAPCEELGDIAEQRQVQTAVLYLSAEGLLPMPGKPEVDRAVDLARALDPRAIIPVHCNDFTHGRATSQDFLIRAARAGLSERVVALEHGEGFALP